KAARIDKPGAPHHIDGGGTLVKTSRSPLSSLPLSPVVDPDRKPAAGAPPMGFFVGLFLGVVIGVGLVMAFAHSENARSKRRAELAATVAALSKMTVEDSRKLLPAEFYPSWVVFSQRQKFVGLSLTNQLLQAASELIRTSVEPVLEQYKSAVLSSLKFSKLTLGTVAPQFTGEIWHRGIFV
ncbi:hypothetical protein GW17_00009062, partial [Ensete ventricosum]